MNQPIVFRKRHKPIEGSEAALASSSPTPSKSLKATKQSKGEKLKRAETKNTAKLSFNADEEEEEEE